MTPPSHPAARLAPLGARLVLDAAWQALSLGSLLATPAAAAWDLAKGRGLSPIAQRLGASPRVQDACWLAAASAGEVAAAVPLLRELRDERVVLSVVTPHGVRAASRHAALLAAPPFHPPIDAWPCVARSLRRLRPRALVLVETEIWPNLVRAAAARAPVAVVNARLSDRAFRRYVRVRPLVAEVLRRVSLVAARSEEDAARWRELGARATSLHVVGNVKFDAAAALASEPPLPWAEGAGLLDGEWLACGSTAEGEETLLLDAFDAARRRLPSLRLLLAPKRPERWDEVAVLAGRGGRTVIRRSAWREGVAESPVPPGGVLLLDSVGELARAYRHARAAFVGGSLVPHGGQNLLEPAAFGVPVLHGPHVENFRDVEAVLRAAGASRCVGAESLAGEIMKLLVDPGGSREAGARARDAVASQAGATRRTLDLLRPLLRGAR